MAPGPGPSSLSLRILVAEDNPANQLTIRAMLERLGHQVSLVGTGAAAVVAVQDGGFDLVLMDVHMPVQDGVAATQEIRALSGPAAAVPIVALTADATPSDRLRYLEAGMNGCIGKPFRIPDLRQAIGEIVPLASALEVAADPAPEPAPLDAAARDALTALIARIRALIPPR